MPGQCRIIASILLLIGSDVASAATFARGVVFADRNGNGVRDLGEPGIHEAHVSNGRDIVHSDRDGRYKIAIAEDGFVFVIQPRDYRLPVDAQQLPRFYHAHRPKGSPALRYGGQHPTGPLPASIDFALLPAAAEERFSALIFADSQTKHRQDIEYFRRDILLGLQGAPGYAFGMTLGDVVDDDLSLYAEQNALVGALGVPWFNVLGNHDIDVDAANDADSDDSFQQVFGPTTYAFDRGDAHFIVLDDVLHQRQDGFASYRGGFTESQLTFVANVLKHASRDDLIVVALHIPLYFDPARPELFRGADRARLFALLKKFPNVLILSGHSHNQWHYFHGSAENWHGAQALHEYNVGAACGGFWSGVPDAEGIPPTPMSDGTPNGYARLEVDGNRYRLDYRVARAPAEYQIAVHAPKVVRLGSYPNANVYANFFMGNERSRVEFRVDSGDWRAMDKVAAIDPTLRAINVDQDRAEQLPAGGRIGDAVPSRHLWRAALPTTLNAGSHRIAVRAQDLSGRWFEAAAAYRLEH